MPVETTGAQVVECPHCDHVMVMRDLTTGDTHCCPRARCVLQSEEVMLAPTVPEMSLTDEQTTSFYDANPGNQVGVGSSPLDYELADAQTAADLKSFLSRPVRILSTTWAQSDPSGTLVNNITPWLTYMNNPSIKSKLQNYAFIRGNLKLKIVTNASPFLYGSLRAVYQPLPTFKTSTITSSFPSALVPNSQLPGVWITPAHSEGAEFTCPFIFPRSFARIGSATEIQDLGYLDLIVYNPLLSANGSVSSVTVQIYAWLEDVTLAGPTLGAALQADEYGVGAVSAPASAVAAAARGLSKAPVIGKFAKATEIGASAVSNIAKLFGFTNVPVIEDTRPVRNSPFPQIASAEIGYVNEKLALDPKNELSIDPSIAGLSGQDELEIAHFAQRESFLTSTSWPSSAPPDTALFTSAVVPGLAYVGAAYDFTPMSLLSTLFRNWRGDIVFRFRFIATPFHKGRVRISYDPYSSSVQTTGDTGPYVMNRIVDLGAETDVEFRIPYQQALPWCYNAPLPVSSSWTTSSSPAVPLQDTFTNGMISVKVLTALSGPTTTASVAMQVFVRGAENLEFTNPSIGNYDLTPYTVQSEEFYDTGAPMSDVMGTVSSHDTHRALVNFGESIKSLRTLMRRQNLLDTLLVPAATANTAGVYQIIQTRFPPHYGYDAAGQNLAKGTVTPASNFTFNFVKSTPWHLISNCFLAQRGSMNWTFNPSKGSSGIVSRITRYNNTFIGYLQRFSASAATNENITEYAFWINSQATNAGSSLTHTSTTNGHSVVAPSYSAFKFQTTQPSCTTSPGGTSQGTYDGTVYDSLVVEYPYDVANNNIAGMTVERYFGIGTDYTLHFFMNCPTLYYLNAATIVPA